MKDLHLSDIVVHFVLIDVSPELVQTIVKTPSLKILLAPSIRYFSSLFERLLKLSYTLVLVYEIVGVVCLICLNEKAQRIIKFFNEDTLLVKLAPDISAAPHLGLRF